MTFIDQKVPEFIRSQAKFWVLFGIASEGSVEL